MLPTSVSTSSTCSTSSADVNSSIQPPQETQLKATNDDLVSLHAIPDLYDPFSPNSYYETVYKLKASELAREEEAMAQDLDHKLVSRELAAPSAQSGIIPSSMFGEKMLYKQGWKGEGFGLGKEGQGIATPLIGSEASTVLSQGVSKTLGTISQAPLRSESSRIILLRNMVLRGQADESLASETKTECSDFGRVLQCIVREEKDRSQCADDEAVRVFIQFESTTAAEKARNALHLRCFAGRHVQASFYSEAAFSENRFWIPVNP